MTQLGLFPAARGRVRHGDPETSVAAAAGISRRTEDLLAVELANGPGTSWQLAERIGKYQPTVSSALSRMRRDGRAVETGGTALSPSGCQANVWSAP